MPKHSEKIVEVLIPIMIPLQTGAKPPAPKPSAGGPEDVFGFLYWLMTRPTSKKPKPKIPLKKRTKRLLKLLKALDAVQTLQLARQTGIMSA